eukprot:CAMPEP_0195283878 /NCGR_PEP_ID=MMETSP0707-20130614/2277_1 /TAXON_ID=33640 /ORGANISM="Asterionellopsis glacialis, Strain CCMP134" /LENGTH=332 /DNA_ID=CAMNT_0040343123 /DNA_START=154 /DNA_END=1149 /DNA_ORIENTATION=+
MTNSYWMQRCQRLKENDPSITEILYRKPDNEDLILISQSLVRNTSVKTLCFTLVNEVNNTALHELSSMLEKNTTIESLEFQGINTSTFGDEDRSIIIDDDMRGLAKLGRALTRRCCKVELTISNFETFGSHGAKILFGGVGEGDSITHKYDCANFQHINLSKSNIGNDGAKVIANMLSRGGGNTSLKHINLFWNNISDVGIQYLCTALASHEGGNTCTVEAFILTSNPFSCDGIIAISDMLKLNTTLKIIEMLDIQIGQSGKHNLIKSVEHNLTVRTIRVNDFDLQEKINFFTAFNNHLPHYRQMVLKERHSDLPVGLWADILASSTRNILW